MPTPEPVSAAALRVVRRRHDDTIELARVDRGARRVVPEHHCGDLRFTHASLRFHASGDGVLIGSRRAGPVLLCVDRSGAALRVEEPLPFPADWWGETIDRHGWTILRDETSVVAVDARHRCYARFALPARMRVSGVSVAAAGQLVLAGAYEERVGLPEPAILQVTLELPQEPERSTGWRALDVPARSELLEWKSMRVGLLPRAMMSALDMDSTFDTVDVEGEPWVVSRSSSEPSTLSAFVLLGGPGAGPWRASRLRWPGTPHYLRPRPGVVLGVDPLAELMIIRGGQVRVPSIRSAVHDAMAGAGCSVGSEWPPFVLASDAHAGRVALCLHFPASRVVAVIESTDDGRTWTVIAVDRDVATQRPYLAMAFAPLARVAPYR